MHISLPKWILYQKRKKIKAKKKARDLEFWKNLEIGRVLFAARLSSKLFMVELGCWLNIVLLEVAEVDKKSVRDGVELFIDWANMPKYWKRQQWPDESHAIKKLKSKLANVRMKKCVQPGFVKSFTSYFAVPAKAETDVRIVYDGTTCGLNDSLWAPNFMLPTVDSILRNASSNTWFGDIDLG